MFFQRFVYLLNSPSKEVGGVTVIHRGIKAVAPYPTVLELRGLELQGVMDDLITKH